MRSRKRPMPSPSGRSGEAIHDIVARYLDRLNRGETLHPLEIVTEHPDQAEEVLEQLSAFVDLGALVEREMGRPKWRHR